MANSPNSPNRFAQKAAQYPFWAHPDVKYMASEWELLRDCDLGEKQIKTKREDYLPRLEAFSDTDYTAYLDRAVFYNMVSRTLGGMVGSIFRRLPNITNKPDKLDLSNVGQENEDFRTFSKSVAQEVIHMGRCGVLLDRAAISTRDISTLPYLTIYIAESIMTWETSMINGRKQLTKVVLREIVEDQNTATGYTQYVNRYRVLKLTQDADSGKWIYIQEVYKPAYPKQSDINLGLTLAPGAKPAKRKTGKQIARNDFNADSDGRTLASGVDDANIYGPADEVITPTMNGVPFDFIPFIIFGPQTCNSDVEKSPLLDIARINVAHYRSYAHLEHGRFYTALPVYWTNVDANAGGSDYTIGPGVVWEIPLNARAGLIEYNGSGLKYLADALAEKESQVAALGGRLIGVSSRSVSESDNQVQLKDRNEQALLLSCTLALDSGFTRLMRWYALWIDVVEADVEQFKIEFNKDFLFSNVSAREFRAIEAMYLDGVMPIEIVFDYFKRAEVIPDWLDVDEFKTLIHSAASFPDQPDFEARVEGYPDAAGKVVSDDKEKDRVLALELADKNAGSAIELANQNAKNASQQARADHNRQLALSKLQARLTKNNAPKPAAEQTTASPRQAKLLRNQKLQAQETRRPPPDGTTQNFGVKIKQNSTEGTSEFNVKVGNK